MESSARWEYLGFKSGLNRWKLMQKKKKSLLCRVLGKMWEGNITDVLRCWLTVFWNNHASRWWITTAIKIEPVVWRPLQDRTNGSSLQPHCSAHARRTLGLRRKCHISAVRNASTFTQHRTQHGKVKQIGAVGLCWTILLATIYHFL